MLNALAISGYRSLKEIVLPLGSINLITGPNGSGKSSIYRALRLLSDVAEGNLIRSLAREGGLKSAMWAGPESFSREVLLGDAPVTGTVRKKPVSLKLGFASDEFSYCVDLGLPSPSRTVFNLDPIIKRECLWRGTQRNARDLCADRRGQHLRCRPKRTWEEVDVVLDTKTSMLSEYADPINGPELILARESIKSWRFYDHFRSDVDAPARGTDIGTFTPVLSADGADLAAALQTIREIGDSDQLDETIHDAFPGSNLVIQPSESRLQLSLQQNGMLRPLSVRELSDGTLRYLLLTAAILTPRPPELMVLNEPETSLHPDLLPALGRLIASYGTENQMIVVTHSRLLSEVVTEAMVETGVFTHFQLEKSFGATQLMGIDPFSLPLWKWPAR